MSLYLGSTKVSPLLVKTIEKTITHNSDGTSTTSYNTNVSYTQEDPDNLASDLPVVNEWTRPTEWPDLDALPALTEGVYLTYDNTQNDCKYASFYCTMNTGQYTVAMGHMNGSSWIQDSTQNVNSGAYCEVNFGNSSYDYVIFRLTPASTNHFTQQYFARVPAATLGTTGNRLCSDQYCLERRGKLPYLTSTVGSGDNYRYCTYYMEYDNTLIGEHNTGSLNLAYAWYRARHLKKINFEGWPTSQWNVTSLDSTFCQCNTIEELDLSSWDTRNWHVTVVSNMFSGCFKLKKLLIPFITTNWGNGSGKTLSLANTFQSCYTLEELDLSSWDMSHLNVTSLYATWNGCYHLKKLNIKNWDTLNWVNTSLYYTWGGCNELVNIDLSNWDTSNWKVTNMQSTWDGNYKRRNFNDIKNWDTSQWAVTTLYGTWSNCYKIQELDLSNWNTSNWKVTTLYCTWNSCRSLRSLKVGNWDTSNWKVNNLNATWASCFNLEDSEFFNWDTSSWVVMNISQIFYYCHHLKEIDFHDWAGSSNWALTTISYLVGYSKGIEKLDISNLDLSDVPIANYGSNKTGYTIVYDCSMLKELKLPPTFAGHLNIRYDYCLSRDEIVRIFNALPTALSGATIQTNEIKYKLSTADIAIATNKGYTVT